MSLLDGRVLGVDGSSGHTMWAFDSGEPLVSVAQAQPVMPNLSIFPGVDGSLYAYQGGLAGEAPTLEVRLLRARPGFGSWGALVAGRHAGRQQALLGACCAHMLRPAVGLGYNVQMGRASSTRRASCRSCTLTRTLLAPSHSSGTAPVYLQVCAGAIYGASRAPTAQHIPTFAFALESR